MKWNCKRYQRNIHSITFDDTTLSSVGKVCLISDAHWDNPHCNQALLKKHLDFAKAHNMPIIFGGDLFCLMQGKYDRRSNKNDIRPEHNTANYLDSIIETAAEWFAPYARNITVVAQGNHETAISRIMRLI